MQNINTIRRVLIDESTKIIEMLNAQLARLDSLLPKVISNRLQMRCDAIPVESRILYGNNNQINSKNINPLYTSTISEEMFMPNNPEEGSTFGLSAFARSIDGSVNFKNMPDTREEEKTHTPYKQSNYNNSLTSFEI